VPEPDVDVLVVGAGPVGLTAAWALARRGLRVRIVDKAPAPSTTSKALVLWSRTLELLDTLDGAASFVAAGLRVPRASIHEGATTLVQVDLTRAETPYAYALMLPQNETERLLAEPAAALGVTVDRSVALERFADDGTGVTATLRRADRGTEEVRAAWLVGCDGAHSTVRHELGLAFEGEPEPNDWILADVHLHGPVGDEVAIFMSPAGVLALFPISPSRFRVVADTGPASSDAHPPDPTVDQVQAVVDARGPAGVRVDDPVWLSGFRIHERKVRDYARGRVFLAGDAAHIHSPAGGQGMNTGMQDALNLAWKLALVHAGRAQRALLDTYSVERSAVGDAVLRDAGMLTRIATIRQPVARWVRDRLYGLLGPLAPVQSRIVGTLTELAIAYPTSPLSSGQGAGARFPVVPLRGDGTTIVGLLRSGAFQLLAFGGATPPSDLGDLVETQVIGENTTLGVTEPTLVLVRPDGYVAWRGPAASVDELRAHLRRFLR
jgi:2-polyprenyl-6-methoxyphenol hydroxylase-like FAD-dependent oxidoreductase